MADKTQINIESTIAVAEYPGRKLRKLLIVLAGIIIGQAVLFGPSLVGQKILLPLDILGSESMYLPERPGMAWPPAHDISFADLVCRFEPERRFAVSQIHEGRFPHWTPNQFAGAPFAWPKFSPFLLFACLTASPVILAWTQMLCAVVAGLGFYLYCRRGLQIGFWPSAVCAWCYPLTGFFIFWQGYPVISAAYWLPWIFLAIDYVVRQGGFPSVAGLAVATGLVLTSGQLDVAGQVLLASGLYVVWRAWKFCQHGRFAPLGRRFLVMGALGSSLGFLLAGPYLLPMLEYAKTGFRMVERSSGAEERPPIGLAALPLTVHPDIYGSTADGSMFFPPRGMDNLQESAAGAYAGVVVALFVAPLAWCNRRHRATNVFLLFLAVFGLSWCLDLVGFVDLLRLPGLNMMSHNRLVFLTAFAILTMAAIGLEMLQRSAVGWRWWFWLPAVTVAGLCAYSVYRSAYTSHVDQLLQRGPDRFGRTIENMETIQSARQWFVRHDARIALFSGLAVMAWASLRFRPNWQSRMFPLLAGVLVVDLVSFGYGRSTQCTPELYYPRLPVVEKVLQSIPGRTVGYSCLPASLSLLCGLRDIRGYDAVDPARMMDLMMIASDPNSPRIGYAQTQWYIPSVTISAEGKVRLSPVLDMLGVRYFIYRGAPPPLARPVFQEGDYGMLINSNALPRAYVPHQVRVVADHAARLQKLAAPEFDPREVAYVEAAIDVPLVGRGKVEIVDEVPNRVKVAVNMETQGMVVLADLWDKGWRAYLDGKLVPILRANHALRGVIVPAGIATLEFRYEPASFALGLYLAASATGVLLFGIAFGFWKRGRHDHP